MLDILSQDFIRTAHAKGVPDHEILFKHALRGGLLPVVAFLGPAALAGLISGLVRRREGLQCTGPWSGIHQVSL